jgi:hypothetical protein
VTDKAQGDDEVMDIKGGGLWEYTDNPLLVKGLWDQEYFYEQLKLSKQREQEESGK